MGREVRRVPADWTGMINNHPHHDEPFSVAARDWKERFLKWEAGERDSYWTAGEDPDEFWVWSGPPPNPDNYRPDWPEESRTHLMMYETTTEGTPISPAFLTPEELARWLADNKASSFGNMTATYEQWLATINVGSAPSAMFSPQTGLVSGVEATALDRLFAAGDKAGDAEQ